MLVYQRVLVLFMIFWCLKDVLTASYPCHHMVEMACWTHLATGCRCQWRCKANPACPAPTCRMNCTNLGQKPEPVGPWPLGGAGGVSKFQNGYGSIPIDTFLVRWTSIYQLFWCELQGYKVLTHCQSNLWTWTMELWSATHFIKMVISSEKGAGELEILISIWMLNLS